VKFYDVIIIGGGPSGLVTGITAKKLYPEKSILIITEEEKGLVPCGIPYIFHDLESVEQDEMGFNSFLEAGGEIIYTQVKSVDTRKKRVFMSPGRVLNYDKLVFATGSIPAEPEFITGYSLSGVEYIHKSFTKMKQLKEKVDKAKKIAVVGGGFIGVEIAEQIAKVPGKTVALIECEQYCLGKVFSDELCREAAEAIKKTKIQVYTNVRVDRLMWNNGKVDGLMLYTGEIIYVDLVIMAIGYQPNTWLAGNAGLELTESGAIKVDRYLRSSARDICAVGDCSETIGFITGAENGIMLASTATAEARVLAYNLFGIKIERHFPGTIGIFSTQINGLTMAAAGINEKIAAKTDIDYITGSFTDLDRHPEYISDASKLAVKLYVSPGDGSVLGGEVWGGKSVGEIINIVGMAIQKQVNVYELISYQIGTHPLLTGAPTKYALIEAAEEALYEMKSAQCRPEPIPGMTGT
jgi:NADPH-dependent 2,4-dienoyl-CoA reductase/sulfur reductase-like enzyme